MRSSRTSHIVERKRGSGASRRSLTLGSSPRKAAAGVALAGLAFGLVGGGAPAFAAVGGGGVGGGSGGSGGAADSYALYALDHDLDPNTSGIQPEQGWGQSSIDYFAATMESEGGWANTSDPNDSMNGTRDGINQACNIAIAQAIARAGAGSHQARVVMVGANYSISDGQPLFGWGDVGGQGRMADWFNTQTAANAWQPTMQSYDQASLGEIANVFTANIPADPQIVCVALNEKEPSIYAQYQLQLSTDKVDTFDLAGSTGPVRDMIHASNGGSGIAEDVNARVILHWDGVDGAPTQVTKTVPITNNGDTLSPEFTPADFGWRAWPAGQFWFDVQVDQQGGMAAAVDTADRDPRETWTAAPVPPGKRLTISGRAIANDQVLASGMTYEARISANANGHSSGMTIYDTIKTDKVFIGATDKDVADTAYVLDPENKRVENAEIKIDRSSGQVVVSGRVSNIPGQFQGGEYTLVVPTYVVPTGGDYEIKDGSIVCYGDATMTDPEDCIAGNDEQTRKVTPAPDKVWVLDEEGALKAVDPEWTNQQGSDQKVFLPSDAVSAVVNGKIQQKLASNLTNYQLIDDWTKAAKYVDFSDASKAKVFYETAPGSGTFEDVTDMFTITVKGTKTTATAKASFLGTTANQAGDRATKLVVSGEFRDDYDTDGDVVKLFNDGAEVWNNETIQTNTPPVFTWTPDPNKQVLGSAEESGDLTHENINGLSVFPGQKLEYSVGVDLRVPGGTARGVKSLAVMDTYDPQFTPDKTSVEFWDSRDATNPKPVPRSAYKLTWDAASHSFTATFTQEWIDKNVNVQGSNSEWAAQGWLTMRFTGTVKDTAAPGSTVKNQAFEILNGAKTATEIPEVKIPSIKPDKEDLNTDLIDIDGKTVVEGDTILYRLTMDATPGREDLAYNVHKLGMVDDFDEEYLTVDTADIRVANKATGEDVTNEFNIQVIDGVAYVFAKTVDTELPTGEVVKGDPQPKSLKDYDAAAIDPLTDAIIDQDLLGEFYYVTIPATVIKEKDGYVIENQARENLENSHKETKIVSNPLKDIDPDKDVVISPATGDDSIDGSEVPLHSVFNYRLNSSEIPADRAYVASSWSLRDTFDRVHDSFTGIWAVYANTDVFDGDKRVFKKGDLLADSSGFTADGYDALFTVTFDDASYTLTATATQAYLDLVNTRGDRAQAFSVYTKMERIAPAEKVDNVTTETYNGVDRESNVVWTSTPEHPAIDVEKFTLDEGLADGDRDAADQAYTIPTEDLDAGTRIGIRVTNTGDVPLTNVILTDETHQGLAGTVTDIICVDGTTEIAPDKIGDLAVGEAIDCTGTLTGVKDGQLHGDTATVTGESIYTGKKVSDEDPWFATTPGKLAQTGGEIGGGIAAVASVLALLGGGLALFSRRRRTSTAAVDADS